MGSEERIAQWLANDPGLAPPALKLATEGPGFDEANPLWIWATNLLFDPGYGVFVEDLLWVSNRDASVQEASAIRFELGPVMFSMANWDRVSQLVKEYANKEM